MTEPQIKGSRTYTPDFPMPDMSILVERRAAASLPITLFGSQWSEWITTSARDSGSSIDYVAGALLCAAATAIGHSRVAQAEGEFVAPAILWIGLVGALSSGKSPAAEPARKLLARLESDEQPAYQTERDFWERDKLAADEAHALWEADVKQAVKANAAPPDKPRSATVPPEPLSPRLTVKDATLDRLVELASVHAKGFALWTDELAAWFGAFGRYSGGQGADRAIWLEAYEARPYQRDRVKNNGQAVRVERFGMSVFGTIQPDRLDGYLLKSPDDGLVPRFLWIWPERTAPVRVVSFSAETWPHAAFRRLRDLTMPIVTIGTVSQPMPIALHLTSQASDLFFQYRSENWMSAEHMTGHLAGMIGKAPGTVLRLALVLELLWWSAESGVAEPTSISTKAIGAAAHLVEAYFLPMAERVLGDAAVPATVRNAAHLAKYIQQTRATSINSRQLQRSSRIPGFRGHADVCAAAIKELEEASWLIPAPGREGAVPGRQRHDWTVNPRVWGDAS